MGRSARPIQGWNARLGMFRLLTGTASADLVITTTAATLMESLECGVTPLVQTRDGITAMLENVIVVIKVRGAFQTKNVTNCGKSPKGGEGGSAPKSK